MEKEGIGPTTVADASATPPDPVPAPTAPLILPALLILFLRLLPPPILAPGLRGEELLVPPLEGE